MLKHPKVAFIFFILWLAIIFLWYKGGKYQKLQNDKLLKNNIEFTGNIKSYKISGNHCFAVILIDSIKSTVTSFDPRLDKRYFPYAIKNGRAEVYRPLCEETAKEITGRVSLNSNKRTFTLESNKKTYELEIGIISDDRDIAFIKDNTTFK